jgi:hypothetical protein
MGRFEGRTWVRLNMRKECVNLLWLKDQRNGTPAGRLVEVWWSSLSMRTMDGGTKLQKRRKERTDELEMVDGVDTTGLSGGGTGRVWVDGMGWDLQQDLG